MRRTWIVPFLSGVVLASLAVPAPTRAAAPAIASYLCYKAKLAKGQPKFPKGLTTALRDGLGGPQSFDVKKLVTVCNPIARDGGAVAHPSIHEQGLAIKATKGGPKFAKSTVTSLDPFAQRNLTLTGPSTLLSVTPLALGDAAPAAFPSDPTIDPSVSRFKCYKAKLAKGSPKYVAPPPPSITDDFFPSAQSLAVKKPTKLCLAADVDGETPDVANHTAAQLVCYAIKLAKGSPKFAKPTVATNDADFAPHVLIATAPSELCLASQPVLATPTPTATPTPGATSTPVAGKLVFVTSVTFPSDFSGPPGSDPLCGLIASEAGLAGTFRSWISYSGDSPSTRFTQSSGPYVLFDGTPIANNWADLTDGTIAHGIDQDEHGNSVANTDVWTGTEAAGTVPPENPAPPTTPYCNNWQNDTNIVNGVYGNTGHTDAGWSNLGQQSCDHVLRLYCVQQ